MKVTANFDVTGGFFGARLASNIDDFRPETDLFNHPSYWQLTVTISLFFTIRSSCTPFTNLLI